MQGTDRGSSVTAWRRTGDPSSMSGGRRCAGLKRQAAGNDGGSEVVRGKDRNRELGGQGNRGRLRRDDRSREMHDRADRAVVVGRAGGVAILVAVSQRLAGLLGDPGPCRAEQIRGMDVREAERQLQQQREEPEARAEAPYRPKPALRGPPGEGVTL